MSQFKWVLLSLSLIVAGCGEPQPDLRPLSEKAVILAFGDSLTSGTGAEPSQSYPVVLTRLSGHKVINAGVPGEMSAEGLKRLPTLLKENHPELVILIHGGNDWLRKRPPAAIQKNLEAMVRLIHRQGAQVMLVGVPRPALLLSNNAAYRELATSLGVPVENDILVDILKSREMKSDAVHPNAQGYAKLAQAIFAFLKERQAL
jgi:lysophospholipase L1-like esterase